MTFADKLTNQLNLVTETELEPPQKPPLPLEQMKLGPLDPKKHPGQVSIFIDTERNQYYQALPPEAGIRILIGRDGPAGVLIDWQKRGGFSSKLELTPQLKPQAEIIGQVPVTFDLNQLINNIADKLTKDVEDKIFGYISTIVKYTMRLENQEIIKIKGIKELDIYKEFLEYIKPLGIDAYPILNQARQEIQKGIDTETRSTDKMRLIGLQNTLQALIELMNQYRGVNGMFLYFRKLLYGTEQEHDLDMIAQEYRQKLMNTKDDEAIEQAQKETGAALYKLFSRISITQKLEPLVKKPNKIKSIFGILSLLLTKGVKPEEVILDHPQAGKISTTVIRLITGYGWPVKATKEVKKPEKPKEKPELRYVTLTKEKLPETSVGAVHHFDPTIQPFVQPSSLPASGRMHVSITPDIPEQEAIEIAKGLAHESPESLKIKRQYAKPPSRSKGEEPEPKESIPISAQEPPKKKPKRKSKYERMPLDLKRLYGLE